MPGLVPGIHVLCVARKIVDGRDKPGHDAVEVLAAELSAPQRRQQFIRALGHDHVAGARHNDGLRMRDGGR
uniref:Uncharacterized protein n=1 Tax=Bradyrhizobium ottawaense TaxID=931866 RepID=A0A2U8P379_9BRAD|nr:hypothetical protein CIT37_07925 [Bradyrhizobium ottawaense]